MIYRCPACQKRIPRNSVSCRQCGWSLEQQLESNAEKTETPVETQHPKPQETLEMHVERAIDAITRQQFSDALNSLNRAIVDAPQAKLAEIYSLRGYAHLMLDDYRRAENDCTAAIEQRGPDSETLAWRAAARGHQNKWRSAIEDLTDARMLAQGNASEYEALIDTYRQEASRYFGEMVQRGKSDQNLFCHRGWVYLLIGNFEKANRDFQLAINLEPNHSWSLVGTAETHLASGKPEIALSVCERLATKNYSADQTFQRSFFATHARALAANHRPEAALSKLNELRKISSGPLSLLQCGQLAMEIGSYVSAVDDLTRILDTQSQFLTARKLRGQAYAAISNFKSAEKDFSSALEIMGDGRDAEMLTMRGEMRLQQDKIESALRDFDAAERYEDVRYNTFLGRAKAFELQENYDRALLECEKAARLDETVAEIYSVHGQILFDLKKYPQALEHFSQAIQLAKDDKEKGRYFYRRGTTFYELNQLKDALADFEDSERLQPSHAGTKIWKAATLAKKEDWSGAINSLQQATEVRPSAARQYELLGHPVAERALAYFDEQINAGKNSANLFKNRGLAYQFMGNVNSAIENYTHAIDKFGFDPDIHIHRGQMLARQSNHAFAIDDFTEVIKRDPKNHSALFSRAISLTQTKKLKLAWSDISKATKLAPQQPRYLTLKGELLRKQKRLPEAIQSYSQAIEIDHHDSLALRLRGSAFQANKQYLKAVGDFTRSLELNPRQPEVIALRGDAHLKNGELKLAREDFELALTRDDRILKAYCGRAQVLTIEKEYEKALIWLTKAFHRFSKFERLSELLIARGKTYYQMGRFLPAISDFTKVMELRRGDAAARQAARYGRALALVQQGELDNAKKDFEKILRQNPKHPGAKAALKWMMTGENARPVNLAPPEKIIRPQRPPRKMKPVKLLTHKEPVRPATAHDDWIVRKNGNSRKEYGPVSKLVLDQWVSQGRIPPETRLLRSDWNKWRRATYVYPELRPQIETDKKQPSSISSFPEIEVKATPETETEG
jgi:tetratricopeptide (TPR) repeat protein